MRRVTLLRHAKSSWDQPGLSDAERPLNKRGLRDAPIMGQRLKAHGARPEMILSSDAVRALTTAQLVASELGVNSNTIRIIPDLYLASPQEIIRVIAAEAGNCKDVMVVGHNPGMTDLAVLISNARIDNLPTCAALAIDTDCQTWADLGRQPGTLAWFDYPKKPA